MICTSTEKCRWYKSVICTLRKSVGRRWYKSVIYTSTEKWGWYKSVIFTSTEKCRWYKRMICTSTEKCRGYKSVPKSEGCSGKLV